MSDVDLVVAPCSHEAAKYAVEKWHYSRTMPKSKLVKFGAWENGEFIGAVIFGMGANNQIGSPYSLTQHQCCELVRVALSRHQSPTSQIVSKTLKELAKAMPGLRLVVSYADTAQSHYGGIYQAMNWIYVGFDKQTKVVQLDTGEVIHKRVFHLRYGHSTIGKVKGAMYIDVLPKHKYLYPLDKAMRRQIEPLAKPYPKRAGVGEIESRLSTTE